MTRLLVCFLLISIYTNAQESISCSTISDLQSHAGSKNRIALVTGTVTDTFSGLYYWDELCVMPPNNTSIIQVTGITTGRWLLRVSDSGATPILVASISSGNTAEQTIISKTIKANLLGTNRLVNYKVIVNVSSGATLLPSITFRVKYGTAVLSVMTSGVITPNLTNKTVILRGQIQANGATNAQVCSAEMIQDNLTFGSVGPVLSAVALSIDSTQDQLFSITAQLGTGVGAATLTFLGATITMQ